MSLPFMLLVGTILLGTLVFFHELGHFLAAKAFGVKVLKFSLGFGPRVWSFKRGETEYQLAALPLGGFVKMAGEDPTAEVAPEDKGRGFAEQKPYKRALIALAGPAVNLLLPPLVFFMLALAPQQKEPAVIGQVLPDEPGEKAGLRPGDRIVQVDGVPVVAYEQVKEIVEKSAGRTVQMTVERDGQPQTLQITPSGENEHNPIETVRKGKIGVVFGKLPAYVGVVPNGRAAQAGLQTFDRVMKVNGQPAADSGSLERALRQANGGAVTLEVVRSENVGPKTAPVTDGKTLTVQIPAGEGSYGIERADLYVRDVEQQSRAWAGGLRPGDHIVAVNGAQVQALPRFQRILEDAFHKAEQDPQAKGLAMLLTVERDGARQDVAFEAPIVERQDPMIGPIKEPQLGFNFHPRIYMAEASRPEELVKVSYAPGEAVNRALATTAMVTRGMVLGIAGLFTGKVSTRSVGGPIMLYQLAAAAAEQGLAEFLKLFTVISINLGLMNLLPIPVLDGFHILVSAVEGVSRRPVPMRFREIANYVGFAMLLALMVLAFKNDIVRSLAQ